jgi:xanthosine utilization system XapX-like protein
MTPNLLSKWLTPGIGIKRWLVLLAFGLVFCAIGLAFALLKLNFPLAEVSWLGVTGLLSGGAALISWALWQLFETLIVRGNRAA